MHTKQSNLAEEANEWSIVGKVVLITGANTGIGKATAMELAKRGAARIIIACRNVENGEKAAEDIREQSKTDVVVVVRRLDLSSNESVRRFVADFLATEKTLHVLINNAGMLGPSQRTLTGDGNELTFATNHLGHFLLTTLLLDLMKQSAPSRIINLTSHWLLFKLYGGYFHLGDDPSFQQFETDYSGAVAYSQSKLANVLFTKSLHKRLAGTNVSSFSVHPGIIGSDIAREFHVILRFLYTCLMKTPATGATTSVYLATEPGIEKLSSNYFIDSEVCNPGNYSDELAEQLWEISERLTAPNV